MKACRSGEALIGAMGADPVFAALLSRLSSDFDLKGHSNQMIIATLFDPTFLDSRLSPAAQDLRIAGTGP